MASTVTITFGADVSAGDYVELSFLKIEIGIPGLPRRETWQSTPRYSTGFIEVQAPTGNPGERSALQFIQYFNLDYGKLRIDGSKQIWAGPGINENQVIITAYDYLLDCYLGFANFASNNVNVTGVISNCGASSLSLTSVTPSQATVPCGNYRLSILTSNLCPNIFLNGVEIESSNAANPYVIDLPRDINNRFSFVDGLLQTLTIPANGLLPYFVPSFNEANIVLTIDVSLLGGGATLTAKVIIINSNPAQTFTYSLDGVAYQSSNIFTGQPSGAGILYVKDNFGCVKTKTYEITDFSTRDPYLFISKANGMSFFESQVIDDQTIFVNEDNSFAKFGLEDITYCEEEIFKTTDVVTIQFKSNYDTPTVYLRHDDATPDTALSLSKKTTNLNRFQNMDCWYYKYEEGLIGIYFTSGDTYDDLDLQEGTYNLNGNLPDFAIVGTTIELVGVGIFQIVDIVYDSVINKKAIIIESTYNGSPTQTRVRSYYDLLPFEVYEFTIDWSIYGAGVYDVLIDNTDTNMGTVQHLTENIIVQDELTKTLAIKYYNENNRDIFYKFGIENFIRVPYVHVEGGMQQKTEINIGDLTSTVSTSSVNETDTFTFDEVTKAKMRRIVIALSCEHVFINGIGYIKSEEVEVENIPNTNLYTLKATMIKTNINYNNNRQGQEGLDSDVYFDVPTLITDGTNNLKA